MPRKAVKKDAGKFRIKPEADSEQIKTTRRRANISTFKPRSLSALTQYMIDNGNNGKAWQELFEEFRADCPHVFVEIANLSTSSSRISFHICKSCGILVKNSAGNKPSGKNRLGGEHGEASEES